MTPIWGVALAVLWGCEATDVDDPSAADTAVDGGVLDGGADLAPIDAAPVDAEPPPEITAQLTPAQGSMAGYYEVTLTLDEAPFAASAIERVSLGDLAGIYLRTEGEQLVFTVQGHRTPGPVPLVIEVGDDAFEVPDAFVYDPPRHPEVGHVVAVGASISQGFMAGAPTAEGLLGSPPAWVARQAGAYMGLPLLVEGTFEQFTIEDVAPPPLCETPDVTQWVTQSVARLTAMLGASPAGEARVDATLEPSHLGLAGAVVSDILYAPQTPAGVVLAHLIYATDGRLFEPLAVSPLDRAEALAPDVIVAIDFYGNDVLLDEPEDTMEEEEALRGRLVADITATVERMAATGAQVFVGDMPPSSLMPDARMDAALIARDEGDEAAAAYEAGLVITDERTRIANEALYAVAARLDNVHLVPTAQTVIDLVADGMMVDGEMLTFDFFGGLIGLDGTHFTRTGYAVAANLVIDAMNDAMGLDVPRVDLAAVLATDTESPAALRAAGVPIEMCLR